MKTKEPVVTVIFMNRMSDELNNVELVVGSGQLSTGRLVPDKPSINLSVPWPKAPQDATVTFKKPNSVQQFTIPVKLTEVTSAVYSGSCKEITVSILSYEKAEVACKGLYGK